MSNTSSNATSEHYEEPTEEAEPGEVLAGLRADLATRGIAASGPHFSGRFNCNDYLLFGGCRAYAELDPNGCWQVLIYAGDGAETRLVRMADPDGGDWPGDSVWPARR